MSEPPAESTVDKEIDLRGTACPMNWVKAKLTLEQMEPGQVLEMLLDDGDPIRNVPRSVRDEGHKILKVIPHDGFVRLFVARGEL